jgi:asparagine synthase (glutamine-hydrolysing)
VANYLGTNHTEYYVTEKDILDVIPLLPDLFGEPFADSSQVPTYLVSKLARQSVTVSLSGDAGDELFGGYNRYLFTKKFWNRMKRIPLPIREKISKIGYKLSPESYNNIFGFLNFNNVGEKIHKSLSIINSKSESELFLKLTSIWQNPSDLVLGSNDLTTMHSNFPTQIESLDFISQMMSVDLMTYLSDDILCKVDRSAMGVSLETRVPFLDHKVMEFAFCLPLSYKINNNQTKWILRQILYKYVPKELIERPKMGFGMPIDEWLRGDLRDWAESLLNRDRLVRDGYFNPDPILEKWHEHLSCRRNWAHQLWNILIFQMWIDNQ